MAVQREPKPSLERVPPQNIEAEQAVLGAMLLNSEAVGTVIEILHEDPADLFYLEAHRQIFSAIITLFRLSSPVDEITLVDQLKRQGQYETSGGAAYIGQLTSSVPTSANAEFYAKIVLNAGILRKLINTCTTVAASAYEAEGDANELLDQAERSIFAIAQTRELNPISKVGDLINNAIEQIEKLITSHSGISGLPTGYTELDEKLSGLQPSDMVVLAARPSVGKTAFALNVASQVAIREGKGVLIFSLEMSREQLAQRLLCMEGRIDSARLRSGFLAREEMSKLQPAASRLYSAPIYIDDTANITMLEIRSKARRHKAQYDVQLIIIDYLQLMSGSNSNRRSENRQVEISEISRGIKGLARELHVPVIALSQLSREAEKDDTGVPKLSHLRESGSIEQDADVVMMLWRPPAHQNPQDENLIKLSIAKQRNGPTGIIDLLFIKNMQRFENMTKAVGAIEAGEDEYNFQDDDGTPF